MAMLRGSAAVAEEGVEGGAGAGLGQPVLHQAVGVGEASVGEIDLVNIRQATHLAMARAVRSVATWT